MKREKLLLLITLAFIFIVSLGKLADIYGEFLWFKTMEYSSVFRTILLARGLTGIAFGFLFFLIAGLNLYLARKLNYSKARWELTIRGQNPGTVRIIPVDPKYVNRFLFLVCLALSIFMGIWPSASKWGEFIRFFHQTPFLVKDPVFNKDVAFFVFSYPVCLFLQKWFFYTLLMVTLMVGFIYIKDRSMNLKPGQFMFSRQAKTHLSILAGFILLLIAWDRRLKILGLLYSSRGVAFGASYTDMHAQLIGYWMVLILAAACAFLFWINISVRGWKWPLLGLAGLFALSLLVTGIYPWALQKFIVEPNELVKERTYIQYNIQYSRTGYNLDQIKEGNFPGNTNLNLENIQKNSSTLKNVKLWDKNPLKQSFSELQEMRLYYDFIGVDEDRYLIDGEKMQIMLSSRELDQSKLPETAQTWENKHFKYTHGYGLCISPVNHVTEKGLPNLLIKDIPPVSQSSLSISRPEIYYGEANNEFVIVKTATQEFDYPKGDNNVYTKYEGSGGVLIGSYFKRLIFSLKFGDPKILLTNYITPQSRIMFHRQIKDIVKTIAPFLTYDRDPYPVISEKGRIFWIQDAYTITDKYPYSEPSFLPSYFETDYQVPPMLPFAGRSPRMINYIRNSVKVIIDAYDGSTTFYLVDEKDPIIQTYRKIFPGLFKPLAQMPQDLRSHLRYPQDLFEIQSNMYRTYHMGDAQVFYNKEDLWDLPKQKGLSGQEEESFMKGYYLTMRLPGKEKEEFLLMVPFTPNNKSNMIAWMCAQCDGPDYGKLLVYKFPKEKLIYGPRQIEARIDQQTEISSELTLWSQQGSEVFRGDLLVIPIEESVLYIEPIYLMSADKSNLPELKRVIVVYGEKIKMAQRLSDALENIFGKEEQKTFASQSTQSSDKIKASTMSLNELAKRANEYFQNALESLHKADWVEYGHYQIELQRVIQDLLIATEGK